MSARWPRSRSTAKPAISVPRFYVVHDCGQIINPDGLTNQIDGNVVETVSRTLTSLKQSRLIAFSDVRDLRILDRNA